MENGCCISWKKHFFIYKFVSLLTRGITVHKISTIHFVNYATMNAIHIFVFVVIMATTFVYYDHYRSKPFAAEKKRVAGKKRKIRVFNTEAVVQMCSVKKPPTGGSKCKKM